MGLELLASRDVEAKPEAWARYVNELMRKQKELARRREAGVRVKLYRDDYKKLLSEALQGIFNEAAVLQVVNRLIPFVGNTSFLKQIADKLGRPLYARAPQRRVVSPDGKDMAEAQLVWNKLAAEMDIDAKMDTIARLLTATNGVLAWVRYVDGLGMQLDVVTPDMCTVVPHPEVPTKALAVAYATDIDDRGEPIQTVVWDDKRYFIIERTGQLGKVTPHDFGVLPFVEIHRRGRTCHYWDESSGADLVAQTLQSMFVDLINIKKIKNQSHIQLTFTGDLDGLVKNQVMDELSILVAQNAGGAGFSTINLESDPSKYLSLKQANEAAVSRTYGIGYDKVADEDVELRERVAELAAILAPAEVRIFDVVRRLSRGHEKPELAGQIPDEAQVLVDLGQIHNRVDRKTQLEVRQIERSMGYRSGVDDVLEDNPEFGGDRERAMAYIDEKMEEEAIIVERRRALNMSEDASVDEPGQDPAANGAMGPKVRDGEMTADEAAEKAVNGAKAKEVEYGQPAE